MRGRLQRLAEDPVLAPHANELVRITEARLATITGRDKKGIALSRAVADLPAATPSRVDLDRDCIAIGTPADLAAGQRPTLFEALNRLKPWRKGPFDFFGLRVESEWNSALKWDRLAGHLPSQRGKRVLDIGSSSGYYLLRLAAQQPALALGIDPTLAFYFQFEALQRYLALENVHTLPLRLEELPELRRCFDTVLCMGILYHRRSPLDTLAQIHRLMALGGQLVLETLVIEGDTETALFPADRYACMRNVFFIPTVTCLTHWLSRCGYADIRCIDVTPTTTAEQRKTDWIDTQSLEDFLDPADPTKTIEGYPAPVRAIVMATANPR